MYGPEENTDIWTDFGSTGAYVLCTNLLGSAEGALKPAEGRRGTRESVPEWVAPELAGQRARQSFVAPLHLPSAAFVAGKK